MIFEIDIWRSEKSHDDIAAWCVNAREATQESGFGCATLHQVYKQINQRGYDFVSIVDWDDASSRASAISPCETLIRKEGNSAPNLYSLINSGGDLSASDPGNLIVTNPYRIDRASSAQHAEMWEQSKQHMEGKEGFINARFFEAIESASEYIFVSRAEWRSEDLFMRQFAGRNFREIVAPFESMFSICFSRVVVRVEQNVMQYAPSIQNAEKNNDQRYRPYRD
ncbi:MAG: hypothetical protein U1E20_03050 [Methylocystis sp.]|uniref:antibiotic biosynthesis monooxygenase family protein n=1 Tax=Methylocystis sp. TaxID=1911079 RepID=UPI003931B674